MMIMDGQKWRYLAIKILSALLRGIKLNDNGDYHYYCIYCLYLFKTESKLSAHKNVSKNHDNCYIEFAENDKNVIKYNCADSICYLC